MLLNWNWADFHRNYCSACPGSGDYLASCIHTCSFPESRSLRKLPPRHCASWANTPTMTKLCPLAMLECTHQSDVKAHMTALQPQWSQSPIQCLWISPWVGIWQNSEWAFHAKTVFDFSFIARQKTRHWQNNARNAGTATTGRLMSQGITEQGDARCRVLCWVGVAVVCVRAFWIISPWRGFMKESKLRERSYKNSGQLNSDCAIINWLLSSLTSFLGSGYLPVWERAISNILHAQSCIADAWNAWV